MAQYAEDLCCDITSALLGEEGCAKLSGGITDVRLGCLKYFSWTENDCTSPSTAYITAITAVDPSDGVTPVTPLYKINIKKKTGEHIFLYTYDEETNTTKREGSITFDVVARDDAARCAFEEYIGQEVAIFFKYKGSDEWFVEGRQGGLRVRLIEGGSGTDASRATSFEISGDDMPVAYKRIFDTDAETTETLVDTLTN